MKLNKQKMEKLTSKCESYWDKEKKHSKALLL